MTIDTTKFIEIQPGLWYEIETGKPFSNKHKVGKFGGGTTVIFKNKLKPLNNKNTDGYYRVWCEGKTYLWHRLVYEYFKGPIPEGMVIDHKNNKRDDDRIENLHFVSNKENCHKSLKRKDNTSGYTGVNFNGHKWYARIMVNKKSIHLGFFDTKKEAAEAYKLAKIKYHGAESISPLKEYESNI